jgi:transcriptional regulator with XRE-family HTH domain
LAVQKIVETVASNIKRLRQAAGWSQEELAERADLHRTYIGSVERGERNISIENVEKIARALEVSPDSLLKQK